MTDVLIDTVTWTVEVQELDWWTSEDEDKPEFTWIAHKNQIKSLDDAVQLRDLLKKVYRNARVIKVVRFIEG